jgi:NAD(P)-dependent dehydrogenase (short-subunit alcohol dehydrogenase family)
VNAVGPGPIFTPFHQRRIAAAGETVEQYNAKAAQVTMLKRPGRAEEVAAAILFFWPPTMPLMSPAPCCSWMAV